MRKKVNATSVSDLPEITDVIHDCWFEKKDIVFNQKSAVVEILFEKEMPESKEVLKDHLFFKKVQIPLAEYVLKIHHAENCQIEDKERVDRYDFNRIKYNPEEQIVSVLTGIPIDIRVQIKALDISVEDTGRMVGKKTSISFF